MVVSKYKKRTVTAYRPTEISGLLRLITSNAVGDLGAVVPKLLWICTRVKVEVINNKTTWVRVKSTGGKTYLSKK
jgi:hypothetical protein